MSLPSLDDSLWLSVVIPEASIEGSALCNTIILDPLVHEHYHVLLGELSKVVQVPEHGLFRLGSRWILYVDIIGLVRSVREREKFYQVDLDDATGCLNCTVWRQDSLWEVETHSNTTSELDLLCDQLFHLSCKSQLNWLMNDHAPKIRIGQTVQLKGRLHTFQGKLKLNAYFCRLISDSNEFLNQIVHRKRLHRDVYTKSYDPQLIAQHLKSSNLSNLAYSVVESACRIFYEDGIFTFTKLDLCLHSKLVELLNTNWTSFLMAIHDTEWNNFDQCLLDDYYGEAQQKPLNSKMLQVVIDHLVNRLLTYGRIFPATEPIGGMQAYHTVNGNQRLIEHVYNFMKSQAQSFTCSRLLNLIKSTSLMNPVQPLRRINATVLQHILSQLESDSLIYQIQLGHYKSAQ